MPLSQSLDLSAIEDLQIEERNWKWAGSLVHMGQESIVTKWGVCWLYKDYPAFLSADRIEKDYILGKQISQYCYPRSFFR